MSKKSFTFTDKNLDYHGESYVWDDGTYEVTEFYSINEYCESVDLDPTKFTFEIEKALEIKDSPDYGGYSDYCEAVAKLR